MQNTIKILCCATMAAIISFAQLHAREVSFPEVVSIAIIPVQPQPGDVERMKFLREKGASVDEKTSPVYIVKIQLAQLPKATSEGFRLYFHDDRVGEYGSYRNGIFIKVYTLDDVRKIRGKELRLESRRVMQSTKKTCPDVDVVLDGLHSKALSQGKSLTIEDYPTLADALKD